MKKRYAWRSNFLQENNKLKSQVKNLDKGYVSSEESRLETEIDSLKRQYKEAYETGDTDAMFAAQEALSKVAVVQDRVRLAKDRSRSGTKRRGTTYKNRRLHSHNQRPSQILKQRIGLIKTHWFGSDEVMTYAAFGIHKKLVEEEGFDPNTDEYYTEVDKRIRSEFPQKFQTAKKTGGAQVAPAAASSNPQHSKTGAQVGETITITNCDGETFKRTARRIR